MKSDQTLMRAAHPLSEITRLHAEIIDAARTSLDKAIRIGELLIKIKSELRHGEWLPWLTSNVGFSQPTASNYMRIFRERDLLKLKGISNLAEAYRLLQEPKTAPPPKAASDFFWPPCSDEEADLIVNVTLDIFARQNRSVLLRDVLELRDHLMKPRPRLDLTKSDEAEAQEAENSIKFLTQKNPHEIRARWLSTHTYVQLTSRRQPSGYAFRQEALRLRVTPGIKAISFRRTGKGELAASDALGANKAVANDCQIHFFSTSFFACFVFGSSGAIS